MDDSLKSYARAHVLRARPDIDHRSVENYVTSIEFGWLVAKFETGLVAQLDRFLAKAAHGSGAAPRKMSFVELSDAAAGVAAEPVQAAAAPVGALSGPDAGSMPADPVEPAASAAQVRADSPVGTTAPPAAPAPRTDAVAVPAAPQDPAPPDLPDLPDLTFRLPNARAGSAYVQRLAAGDDRDAVVFDEIAVPDGLALTADPHTGTVAGTPLAAGEYTLAVVYRYACRSPGRQRRAQVRLSVTPDPRTMWQNLPSQRTDPYWKEDEQHGSVRGADLSIVAASKRGRSHAHVGSFRDDDYRIGHLADSGWYVAVLADGAGSARYSRRGAAIICEHAQRHILTALTDGAAARIDAGARTYAEARAAGPAPEQVEAARQDLHVSLSRIVGNAAYWAVKAIHEEIQARRDLDGVFKDYSSTALIAICKRYPFGTLCAAYWIGDGAIGVYSRRDGITLLGDVDSGEFSGQTRFLDNGAVDHEVLRSRTRFALVPDMTALVLMTDGVSDAKFETEARLARAADWDGFWNELDEAVGFAAEAPGQERRLLDWLDFWSQGNHDDRTIAIIY